MLQHPSPAIFGSPRLSVILLWPCHWQLQLERQVMMMMMMMCRKMMIVVVVIMTAMVMMMAIMMMMVMIMMTMAYWLLDFSTEAAGAATATMGRCRTCTATSPSRTTWSTSTTRSGTAHSCWAFLICENFKNPKILWCNMCCGIMILFLVVCWHLYHWNLGTLHIVCFNPFLCRMLLDLHAAQAGNEDVKALKQMAPKENIAAIHNFVRCSFSDMAVSSSAYHGIFIWKL